MDSPILYILAGLALVLIVLLFVPATAIKRCKRRGFTLTLVIALFACLGRNGICVWGTVTAAYCVVRINEVLGLTPA